MSFLPRRTDDEHARISADYLPNGPMFIAKRIMTSVMYKFLRGSSKEFSRIESTMNEIAAGWNLTNSTTFLEDWEKTLGIPDGHFPGTGDAETRRKQAHFKLASEGIHTSTQMEWLFSLLGLVVTVYPGHVFWLSGHPDLNPHFATEKESRFSIVVEVDFGSSDPASLPNTFPVPFPWVFTSNNYTVAQSFFTQIIPANVNGRFVRKVSGGSPTGFGYFPMGRSAMGGTTTP